MKNLIDKAWDLNKAYLHGLPKYKNKEIHHVMVIKVGIAKCCLKLLIPAEHGHQDNWEWVEKMRGSYRETYEIAKENFVKQFGCKEYVFPKFCDVCAMPKMEDK